MAGLTEMAPRRLEVPAFDGFRGFSAIAVVLFHCWRLTGGFRTDHGPLWALLGGGLVGVDAFFVISGFVLFLPMTARGGGTGGVRAYLLRRAARIIPAYYVLLLVLGLVLPAYVSNLRSVPVFDIRSVLVAHALFLQTLVFDPNGAVGLGLNRVVWTLPVEAAFYIALPIVALRFHRHPVIGTTAAILITLLWARMTLTNARLARQLPAFAGQFSLGMLLAWVYVRHGDRVSRWRQSRWLLPAAQALALVALALWMVAIGSTRPGEQGTPSVDFLGVALVFAVLGGSAILGPRWARWYAANPVSRFTGEIAYGVYLSHVLIILALVSFGHFPRNGSVGAFAVMAVIVLPASLLVGWLSSRFIEAPARRWARGFASTRLRPASEPARSGSPESPRPQVGAVPGPTPAVPGVELTGTGGGHRPSHE